MQNIPYLLTEEGNPYIRRKNQEERYAKAIWPIPELNKKDGYFRPYNGIGDALARIAFIVHDAQEEAYKAKQELCKSRDEVREEFKAELDDLHGALKRSPTCFSRKEAEDFQKFSKEHYKLHGKSEGITIHLHGTGIGTTYILECPICHEKKDITDVSTW